MSEESKNWICPECFCAWSVGTKKCPSCGADMSDQDADDEIEDEDEEFDDEDYEEGEYEDEEDFEEEEYEDE